MVEELTNDGAEDKFFTVTVDTPSLCKRILKLEIKEEALQAEKSRIKAKLQSDIEVPGFRKGNVPLSFIEKNYKEAVHTDAVQNLLGQAYHDVIHSENLRPLGEPVFDKLEAEDGNGAKV